MLKLRRKLAQYQEIYFMIFMLIMTGMTSAGLNSEDRIYKVLFAVCTVILLLKMAVTDFTFREIAWMAVFTLLLGCNLLRNGEKTLVLTAMGIFGAKNVDLSKVFKYALWSKAVLTAGTIALAAAGVIENAALSLPKNGETHEIYCYGYYHPNMAFANIVVVLLLAILVYGDKLKWYAYGIGLVIMLAAYQIFMCRTGLLVGIVLCLMVLGYRIVRRWKWEKVYMMLFAAIPVVLAAVTMIFAVLMRNGSAFVGKLDFYLNGRIGYISRALDAGIPPLGNVPRTAFDNGYFHLLYNYGWILFGLALIAYCAGIWYCIRKKTYYGVIGLGIMAVYAFMEHLTLSVLWNLPMLYLSWVLFKERKTTDEQL